MSDLVGKTLNGLLAIIRQAVDEETAELRRRNELLTDWMKANLPEMECRNDDDCDHCVGKALIAESKE